MFGWITDVVNAITNGVKDVLKATGLDKLGSMLGGLTNIASMFMKFSNPLTAMSALTDVFNALGKDKSTQERSGSSPNPVLNLLSSLKLFR